MVSPDQRQHSPSPFAFPEVSLDLDEETALEIAGAMERLKVSPGDELLKADATGFDYACPQSAEVSLVAFMVQSGLVKYINSKRLEELEGNGPHPVLLGETEDGGRCLFVRSAIPEVAGFVRYRAMPVRANRAKGDVVDLTE